MENVKRGKLKLKSSSKLKVVSKHKHKKHKKKTSKRRDDEEQRHEQKSDVEADGDDMTPAQRRHAEHQKKRVRVSKRRSTGSRPRRTESALKSSINTLAASRNTTTCLASRLLVMVKLCRMWLMSWFACCFIGDNCRFYPAYTLNLTLLCRCMLHLHIDLLATNYSSSSSSDTSASYAMHCWFVDQFRCLGSPQEKYNSHRCVLVLWQPIGDDFLQRISCTKPPSSSTCGTISFLGFIVNT